MRLKFTLSISMLFLFLISFGQRQNLVDVALRSLEEKAGSWELTNADIQDPLVSDMYTDKHNGVTHIYLQQTHAGIPINGAITSMAIKNNKVVFSGSKFLIEANKKVKETVASLSATETIFESIKEMDIKSNLTSLEVKNRSSENKIIFEKPDFSNSDITAKLVYQLNEQDELILVWDYTLDMKNSADYWSVRADANTGKIINKQNFTQYCTHSKHGLKNQTHKCASTDIANHRNSYKSTSAAIAMADATYNVFALPAESPIHGPQVLTEDPADLTASPLGWHATSTDSWTITRGNNVWAYGDTDGNDVSDGTEPDGGDNLIFDFPYDPLIEPEDLNALAHVNLFYMVNMMHDISYSLGFTEVAGNFQEDNFGMGGAGNDFVRAEGQDGSGTNNANFSTPPDGGNGTMQMFLWESPSGIFKVTEPAQLEGFYDAGTAAFGPNIVSDDIDVIGEAIIVNDDIGGNGTSFTDGCSEITNNISGKIAIIDRGGCNFINKVWYADQAGAIAAIICNIPGASTPGDDGNTSFGLGAPQVNDPGIGNPTIASVGVAKSTCDQIRLSLAAEIPVIIHFTNHEVEGPVLLDGDFDNGIIAHEFGHGISTRLTGGPNTGCLGGEEQMGEGWSDFFSLITTVEPGDTGADVRGIGNFADGQNVNAGGIRHYPYSTDMSINPNTYDYIKGTNIPHGVGEVWASMIWDLYWAFVDLYGWDADWNNTTSGNYIASLLVMDGMKNQVCSPGFVDGRDAILGADFINFDGQHECLIWEVFARRGLGFYASQGPTNNIGDGTENFDPKPTCIEKLKISKDITRFIDGGDVLEVSLEAINHVPQLAEGVVITDEIPAGLAFVPGSASMAETVTGNMISFNIGNMEYEDELTITYQLISEETPSVSQIYHDMENLDNTNDFFSLFVSQGPNIFTIVTSDANSGTKSWYLASSPEQMDQGLVTQPFVPSGNRPTLKFFHKWNTEATLEGGFVQVSTDGGSNFTDLKDEIFENGYTTPLGYGVLAIPNLDAFSGLQADWIPSFADLSAYTGQTIQLRFRYAGDDGGTIANGAQPGWNIDDFEIIDLLTYETTACIDAIDLDPACADAVSFVNSEPESAVVGVDSDHFGMKVYPNPASQIVTVSVSSKVNEDGVAGIFTLDGRLISSKKLQLNEVSQRVQFDISNLPTGVFLVKVETNSGAITEKLIIQ